MLNTSLVMIYRGHYARAYARTCPKTVRIVSIRSSTRARTRVVFNMANYCRVSIIASRVKLPAFLAILPRSRIAERAAGEVIHERQFSRSASMP